MHSPRNTPSIADLFPEFSPEEQKTAEEALGRYVKTVIRIADRLYAEGLTEGNRDGTLDSDRSNINNTNTSNV